MLQNKPFRKRGFFILHPFIYNVQSYWGYSAFKCESCISKSNKINHRFIKRRIERMPEPYHLKLNIGIRLKSSLFFLIECLPRMLFRRIIVVAFYQKKLHPRGFGGMEDSPNWTFVVRWQKLGQGCGFLFVYWGVCDCFLSWIDA